jgi:site-specific DNA-cytosine methylase
VFICALHAGAGFGADSPAAVLSVGARCDGHSQAGDEAGAGTSERPVPGVDIARAVTGTSGKRHDDDTDTLITPQAVHINQNEEAFLSDIAYTLQRGGGGKRGIGIASVLSPSPDPGGVREAHGLAGRSHDREVVGTLREHVRPGSNTDHTVLSPTLRVGPQRPQDGGPGDTVPIIAATLNSGDNNGGFRTEPDEHLVAGRPATAADSDLLPLGLDSHRYRCCGNGVVSNVSEWIGVRLAGAMA